MHNAALHISICIPWWNWKSRIEMTLLGSTHHWSLSCNALDQGSL